MKNKDNLNFLNIRWDMKGKRGFYQLILIDIEEHKVIWSSSDCVEKRICLNQLASWLESEVKNGEKISN